MRIVATKFVEEYWNFETDRALQVTLAVSCADKPARDVIVVTEFGAFRFTLFKLVTADVAPSCIIIFLLLADTKALHCLIRSENRNDLCFPHNEGVKKHGERVFSDFHNGPLVKVIKTQGKDGCCSTYFVLLGVSGVLNLATRWLKNGLKVRIDDERCLSTIFVLVEFDLRLFGAWPREHMEKRHEVGSGAKLFVSRENLL